MNVQAERGRAQVRSRRLVGIDLGIASPSTRCGCSMARGDEVCRRRCVPDGGQPAGDGGGRAGRRRRPGTRLEVVIEPTGPAWLPIAVFFTARGHRVFRVSSAKAADLRRFLSRHAKSNGIDADTLARLPLARPGGLHPLELPGRRTAAALDRRVRASDRLTQQAAQHKTPDQGPGPAADAVTPLTGDLGKADLAVLERWRRSAGAAGRRAGPADRADHDRSRGQQGADRAAQWRRPRWPRSSCTARAPGGAVRRPGRRGRHRDPAAPAIAGRARRPRRRPRRAPTGTPIPARLARTPARAGRGRRPGGDRRSWAGPAGSPPADSSSPSPGLAPRASETGETDRKGQPMTKAGPPGCCAPP